MSFSVLVYIHSRNHQYLVQARFLEPHKLFLVFMEYFAHT